MKFLLVTFSFFISLTGMSQHQVTFIIDSMPEKGNAKLYLAGNFNMWNAADSNSIFKKVNGKRQFTKVLPNGDYEYKITRGSWQTVEEHADFKPMGNRLLTVSGDSVVHLNIGAWADDRPAESKIITHTSSAQVHIMDTAFYMPQLNRYRRIWVYLPKDYNTTTKKYPVIYMHDGQNVFDAATSYSGEWGVDEFLDTLSAYCHEAIVVAIDNGAALRMNEYNPWEFMEFGKGEGNLYVDFLVRTLKPYIDKHFRTLKGKKSTSVAGSSMGGLISLYAALTYPKIFGNVGVFSPAFWTAKGIDSLVAEKSSKMNSRLFFYAGGDENESMIPDMLRIEKEIKERSKSVIKSVVDEQAKHNEAAWRKHFPEFYTWLFCGRKAVN